MYHHSISIAVIGNQEKLGNALKQIEQENIFDFSLTCSNEANDALQAEVVIFYGLHDFIKARSFANPGASFIACLTAQEEEKLSDEEKAQLNDIWQMPLSDYGLHLRLIHLLEEVSNRDLSTFVIGCLDTFINSLNDMVWFKSLSGIHTKVNDYFCEFVGKPREEVEGSTHGEIWGVPETEELSCNITDQAAVETNSTVTAEEVVETDTGKRLFKTIKTPIHGLTGEVLGTVGIAHDLTNMLNLNLELDLFLEMMPLPLMICDVNDHITRANAKFLEFFEIGMSDLLDVAWLDWYEDHILHEISPTGEDIYRRFMHRDGRVSFLKMISHEMNDAFGNYLGVIHVFEDVTNEKELEYNIWKLANTDALTGLANRQAFYEYVKRTDRNEKIHLLYIDLDNFKQVNDIFGHKAGDEALKITAEILHEVFSKDFPARLGGDEFIVCVRRDVSLQEVEEMAQHLIDLMQEKFSAHEKLNKISCSVGVSYNGSMTNGIEPLIKMTDAAMYEAKKQGKACYHLVHADAELASDVAAS